MRKIIDLSGNWGVDIDNIGTFEVFLPGTLDENKYKFVVGTILFVLAAVLPYIILRFLLL